MGILKHSCCRQDQARDVLSPRTNTNPPAEILEGILKYWTMQHWWNAKTMHRQLEKLVSLSTSRSFRLSPRALRKAFQVLLATDPRERATNDEAAHIGRERFLFDDIDELCSIQIHALEVADNMVARGFDFSGLSRRSRRQISQELIHLIDPRYLKADRPNNLQPARQKALTYEKTWVCICHILQALWARPDADEDRLRAFKLLMRSCLRLSPNVQRAFNGLAITRIEVCPETRSTITETYPKLVQNALSSKDQRALQSVLDMGLVLSECEETSQSLQTEFEAVALAGIQPSRPSDTRDAAATLLRRVDPHTLVRIMRESNAQYVLSTTESVRTVPFSSASASFVGTDKPSSPNDSFDYPASNQSFVSSSSHATSTAGSQVRARAQAAAERPVEEAAPASPPPSPPDASSTPSSVARVPTPPAPSRALRRQSAGVPHLNGSPNPAESPRPFEADSITPQQVQEEESGEQSPIPTPISMKSDSSSAEKKVSSGSASPEGLSRSMEMTGTPTRPSENDQRRYQSMEATIPLKRLAPLVPIAEWEDICEEEIESDSQEEESPLFAKGDHDKVFGTWTIKTETDVPFYICTCTTPRGCDCSGKGEHIEAEDADEPPSAQELGQTCPAGDDEVNDQPEASPNGFELPRSEECCQSSSEQAPSARSRSSSPDEELCQAHSSPSIGSASHGVQDLVESPQSCSVGSPQSSSVPHILTGDTSRSGESSGCIKTQCDSPRRGRDTTPRNLTHLVTPQALSDPSGQEKSQSSSQGLAPLSRSDEGCMQPSTPSSEPGAMESPARLSGWEEPQQQQRTCAKSTQPSASGNSVASVQAVTIGVNTDRPEILQPACAGVQTANTESEELIPLLAISRENLTNILHSMVQEEREHRGVHPCAQHLTRPDTTESDDFQASSAVASPQAGAIGVSSPSAPSSADQIPKELSHTGLSWSSNELALPQSIEGTDPAELGDGEAAACGPQGPGMSHSLSPTRSCAGVGVPKSSRRRRMNPRRRNKRRMSQMKLEQETGGSSYVTVEEASSAVSTPGELQAGSAHASRTADSCPSGCSCKAEEIATCGCDCSKAVLEETPADVAGSEATDAEQMCQVAVAEEGETPDARCQESPGSPSGSSFTSSGTSSASDEVMVNQILKLRVQAGPKTEAKVVNVTQTEQGPLIDIIITVEDPNKVQVNI